MLLYFVSHIESRLKFKLDLNSNEFASYKRIKNKRAILFSLCLWAETQPPP
jgi:hypothetical protein